MREEPFVVNYISINNCFLYFSEHWLRRLNDLNAFTSVLKVTYGRNELAYFSWSPQPMNFKNNSFVGVSARYAQSLGLKDEESIVISYHHHVASLNKMEVSPLTPDDWEILNMCSSGVQSSLLNQIQVVWPGQMLVTWVSKFMHVTLRVDNLEPKYEVGRLGVLTDVVVVTPLNGDVPSSNTVKDPVQNTGHGSAADRSVKSSNPRDDDTGQNPSEGGTMWESWTNFLPFMSRRSDNNNKIEKGTSENPPEHKLREVGEQSVQMYRVHPLQVPFFKLEPSCAGVHSLFQPFNVFIHKVNMHNHSRRNITGDTLLCKLSAVLFSKKTEKDSPSVMFTKTSDSNTESETSSKSHSSTMIHVRVYVVEDTFKDLLGEVKSELSAVMSYSEHSCILIPDTVRNTLNLKPGSRVTLETVPCGNDKTVTEIQITPVGLWEESTDSLEILFRMYLTMYSKSSKLLINSEALFPLQLSPSHVQYVTVRLLPTSEKYTFLDSETVKSLKITVSSGKVVNLPETNSPLESHYKLSGKCFSWMEKIISEGLVNLEMSLGLQSSSFLRIPSSNAAINTLIIGKCGSGTSTLARLLCEEVSKCPFFVHHVEIQCRQLKGKKVDTLQKLLTKSLVECVYYQPSIIVLHDIEVLAGTGTAFEEEEVSPEGAYYTRTGEMISLLLEEYQASNSIAVIATATALSKLNTSLVAARGQHMFKTILEIPELTKADRLNVLDNIISSCEVPIDNSSSLELDTIARKSEGFVVQDLVDLADKAIFEAWKRTVSSDQENKMAPSSDVMLQNGDFEIALENTTPLSLRGVDLYRDTDRSWQDVGGLSGVKDTLIELLLWPSQYPELFAQSPLRHQCGILLYGAPGTGKTLLAGALAHECGLNFISVKGPELLSKYIGASEESVRSIFQKAQSAKPCILFFDEFDSLAPRRGHDSTGVTDRVVNQLLTQLDGVEGLQGVWVVAATSRPDLLDPALLRPGRLDRTIQCPLPNEVDRLAILQALSRKIHLSDDVDLREIAGNSNGFSGADLQAVLYTAQLIAVEKISGKAATEEFCAETEVEPESTARSIPEVCQEHMLAALRDTRPSLTPQEREKYNIIYKRFNNSRGGGGDTLEEFSILHQRATLA